MSPPLGEGASPDSRSHLLFYDRKIYCERSRDLAKSTLARGGGNSYIKHIFSLSLFFSITIYLLGGEKRGFLIFTPEGLMTSQRYSSTENDSVEGLRVIGITESLSKDLPTPQPRGLVRYLVLFLIFREGGGVLKIKTVKVRIWTGSFSQGVIS